MEETSESKFKDVATKYRQKLTGSPVEKENTADGQFCDMITKSLNAVVGEEQKELLKLEVHQLVVKAQYGTSASCSLGNRSQLIFESDHSHQLTKEVILKKTVSSINFNNNEYQTFSGYSNMGY